MAKRVSQDVKNKTSRSRKTSKRLETKRVLLASRKNKRNSVQFRRKKR